MSKNKSYKEQDWQKDLAKSLKSINHKWTPSIVKTDPDWKQAKTTFSALEKYFTQYDNPECADRCGDLQRLMIAVGGSNYNHQNLVAFIDGGSKTSFADMVKHIDDNSPNNRRGSVKVHDDPTSKLKDCLTRLDKLYVKYHKKVEKLKSDKLIEVSMRQENPKTNLLASERSDAVSIKKAATRFKG